MDERITRNFAHLIPRVVITENRTMAKLNPVSQRPCVPGDNSIRGLNHPKKGVLVINSLLPSNMVMKPVARASSVVMLLSMGKIYTPWRTVHSSNRLEPISGWMVNYKLSTYGRN